MPGDHDHPEPCRDAISVETDAVDRYGAVVQRTTTVVPVPGEEADRADAPGGAPAGRAVSRLKFVGVGYLTNADAYLAAQSAAQARERRRLAREELQERAMDRLRNGKENRGRWSLHV